MAERRLKRPVLYAIYSLGVVSLIGTIYLIEGSINHKSYSQADEFKYVSKTIFDDAVSVISEQPDFVRPYKDSDVKVLKTYYDYKATKEEQEAALIYYEGTYLQSSGVSYGKENVFDVVSIKDGTLIDVTEDELLGKTIQIKHSDDSISIYQSLSEVAVSKDEVVTRGQTIGKSGTSNVEKDLGNHVHFELIVAGNTVNPETYFLNQKQS